ncbi:hypothetical protein QOZ80_7AG0553070 [Eleusine coracana subsp. coracana]|nr:hypothetical protein QOZ80_7AG0553070 [Eleusine coracana subsp. coracana]
MADRNRKEPTARQNLVERRRTTSFASAATVTRSSSTFPQSAQPNPRSRRRMALPPPPAALPDEIVEEALVRCSPEDPARLFRAALRVYHRSIRLEKLLPPDRRGLRTLDARHGRVLLTNTPWGPKRADNFLAVWNPFTDEQLVLPKLPLHPDPYQCPWIATVLCAAAGDCDHLDCHRGPFQVVFVISSPIEMFSRVYSSEKGKWLRPVHGYPTHFHYDKLKLAPSLLVGGALYLFHWSPEVLKYDLATREMTLIDLPPTTDDMGYFLLRTTEDGSFGVTAVEDTTLKQWSRGEGPEEDNGWTQSEVIELKTVLPAHASAFVDMVGCVEGTGVIFMRTPGVLFRVDPKSGCALNVHVGGPKLLQYYSLHELQHASTGSVLSM